MKVSLIVTTYNRADALFKVLCAIARQSHLPYEVIIADDGSDPATRDVIKDVRWQFRLVHTWLPDKGFRAARARNLSILKARGEYLIMIDGDCIIPAHFIRNHIALSAKNHLIAGGRHLYDPETTKLILDRDELFWRFSEFKFKEVWLGPLRDLFKRSWRIVRACNIGLWRSDANLVLGFDERYTGWGREDSDFVIRLLRAGVGIRSGRFSACVGHLHHLRVERESFIRNNSRLDSLLSDDGQCFYAGKSVLENR